jgi:predicted ATPase/DNA-binding SARP family transcriptional activator
MLHLYLLGAPRLKLDGSHIRIERRKALALLAYLAVTRQPHTRETLAALLWPEYETSSAFAYLRRELWTLHEALGDRVVSDRETIALDTDPAQVWLDVHQFERSLAETTTHGHPAKEVCLRCVEPLTEAAYLYRDRFLAGFSLKDSAPFEEWQTLEGESLHRQAGESLDRLALWYAAAEPQRAIDLNLRRLKLDPLHEPAQRQLMQLFAQTNQRLAALRQYQDYARRLKAELGVEPDPETTRLYDALRVNDSPRAAVSSIPMEQARGNLPTAATPFVGREAELAEIGHLLADPACALLVLTGLGGIGKTRLAIEAAGRAQPHFPDGVYFVSLVGVSSAEFIVPTIADAIGFAFHKERELKAQLLDYLSGKRLLLVVDNFEHLLDGADLMAEISLRVKTLVTSRERLNLQQEWTFEVAGMDVPAAGAARLDESSAVQLFLQCARQMRYAPNEDDWPHIAAICRLADGMPLAIEMAAAWIKALSCQEIQHEIERSLDFLTARARDIPPRQRSLRAVFEYSWGRLTPAEQRLFARLAVFGGGFRRRAAESIVGATPPGLVALIERSLLDRRADGRYSIHEILRQFAAEKLDESGERQEIEDRHALYYADFLTGHQPGLWGGDQKKTLDDISEEIENVRAAWTQTVEQRYMPDVQRMMTPLGQFYQMRGWYDEGADVFRRAIDSLRDTADPVLMARLQSHYGWFRDLDRISMEALFRMLNQSLAILRRPGCEDDLGFALMVTGYCAKSLGQLDAAQNYLAEAYAVARQNGDSPWFPQIALGYGSPSDHFGNYTQSIRLYTEGLAICRERGDQVVGAHLLMALGNVRRLRGEFSEALALFRDALTIRREFGLAYRTADTMNNVGLTLVAQGECDAAMPLFQEALDIYTRQNIVLYAGCSYNNMGVARRVGGDVTEALRLHRLAVELFRRANSAWGKGFGLNDLGAALFLLGDHAGAIEAHRESIALCRANGNRYDLAVGLARLAQAMNAAGESVSAWEHLREAIALAQTIQVLPALLMMLSVAAEVKQDAALWHFIAFHPAVDFETRQRAAAALDGLTPEGTLNLQQAIEAALG